MSHSLRKTNIGNSAIVEATIIDYVTGGEPFTLAELGLSGSLLSVAFLYVQGQNGLYPVLQGGKVVVNISQYESEIASTVGLNLLLIAIVHGT
jgi:hypothetical protein